MHDLTNICSNSLYFPSCLRSISGSIASIPGMQSVSMTTNGVTLSHKLAALQEAGLSGINISLDTLQEKKFEFITRRRGWDKVMRGINQALETGIHPLKVRTQQLKLNLIIC